ncbi:hypothetical protein SSABA_v1c06190 [Spiroplasma sabaudiense Ar-1343]|uniref:Xaa-Pro dipeptidyl-peptidase-like domain-containing protein n=1 Tax=Spiroplasma sabaudiense Ar-1343 TaxID=1276257 RepID=W6AAI5_9MOLU|nr:CocE/NonD family hydrolase [Spiroplasma sabaudiense]AHI54021.1 hypothetical protein SSABA_v1c06190 [Spiroplasma sabaudiense Ar-1343]
MKRKKTTMDHVQRFFNRLYKNLERTAGMRLHHTKKDDLPDIDRMNRIMDVFYKNPCLKIHDKENISIVNFESSDNVKIEALVYKPNPDSKKWIIGSHWFGGHKYWSLYHALILTKMGYNVIAYDFRNHGNSGKSPVTMGATEHLDFLATLNWLMENEKEIDSLGIMGTSMGAYVTEYNNIINADLLRSVNLKFAIADVPYGSIETLFWKVKNQYLKLIPKKMAKKRINKLIDKLNKNNNVDLRASNLIEKLEIDKLVPAAPTLFLHGKYDAVTPVTDSYDLYIFSEKLIPGNEIYTFNNSSHTQSTRLNFETQSQLILNFVNGFEDSKIDLQPILDFFEIKNPIENRNRI